MNDLHLQIIRRRLEQVLVTFFALLALSFVVAYAADPMIYAQVLSLPPAAASSRSLPMTLVLVVALAFIAVLIAGVRRHWRWVFWIILVAFSAAVLHILVAFLQLVGALPGVYPVWFNLSRMGVACLLVVIAVWMWRIAYHHGAWAMGRKKQVGKLQADGLDESGVHPLH